jgi:transposase
VAKLKPWEDSDDLWAVIEPLLPQRQRRFRHPGRKRPDDRLALQGILFVLHTGIAWEHLPQELGYGSGMTCWRRLAEWNKVGVMALCDPRSAIRSVAAAARGAARSAARRRCTGLLPGSGGLLADQGIKRGRRPARPRSIEGGPAASIT